MDLNKVMLIGRLGDDPHEEDDGRVRISVATSYKDKTAWHDITLWEKQAEIASQYLHKGSKIYIECRLGYWLQEVGGKKVKKASLSGSFFIMLDPKEGSSGSYTPSVKEDPPNKSGVVDAGAPKSGTDWTAPAPSEHDDDLPF